MEKIFQSYGVGFTAREKEILGCIAQGLSSKQIAGKLCISLHTVENHRRNMLQKKGAKSSAELVSSNINTYLK